MDIVLLNFVDSSGALFAGIDVNQASLKFIQDDIEAILVGKEYAKDK